MVHKSQNIPNKDFFMGASGLDEDHPPVTDIDNLIAQRNV